MQPQVLALDEPTSQLDPLGRWEVGEAIEQLKRTGDLTIVMTTHETEEVLHLADQVLVLEQGETVLQGPPRPTDWSGQGSRLRRWCRFRPFFNSTAPTSRRMRAGVSPSPKWPTGFGGRSGKDVWSSVPRPSPCPAVR